MLATKKEFENRSKGTDFPQFKTGLLKFEELAFDAPAMAHWREARPQEADMFRTIRNIIHANLELFVFIWAKKQS
jgi:hypothetical protein